MRISNLFHAFIALSLTARIIADPSTDAVAGYDKILADLPPDETLVALGDMTVPVEVVRAWRNKLPGVRTPPSASQTGVNKWTSGIVFYAFNANVSAAHRTATLDAMAEWSAFANLTFTARVAQANYVMINEQAGLNGGNSAVGMIGGAQNLNIGPTSWNRGTLLHELGHALGLIHEHQRSDRNTFVTIAPAVTGDGNFILIPTSTNNGAYDFLSTMHYAKDTFGAGNITPNAGYTQFLDIMGNNLDRILSRGDRDGIALMYGAGPALSTVVTNTKDSGSGSLRTALYKAFDLVTDTPLATPTVTFQIPNTDPNFAGGVFTIAPTDRMTAPGSRTTIDATTQTTFTGNTNASGPEVVLNGALQNDSSTYGLGLRLSGANVTVRGLVINGFSTQGILITAGATGNTVAGCYIGTNAAGTAAVPNTFSGIEINGGATGNRVGGTTVASRNVISGNSAQGVFLRGEGVSGNFVEGNWIGLNAAGTGALSNGFAGVEIAEGAGANTVGGTAAGAGNVLSGNSNQGVAIVGTNGNCVTGNFIGTNSAGTAAIPNGFAGVQIFNGGQFNTIGGTTAAARNLLSGNTNQGVAISGAGSSNNTVVGNYIGLNATGTAALGNAFGGVQIFSGAANNTIGGTAAGAGNVLSGNPGVGVSVSDVGSSGNVIAGNFIGTNPAGTAAIPNAFAGVQFFGGATGNTVGAGNLISGNTSQGVLISGTGTNGNSVVGNVIGLNAAGTAALKNGFSGVQITGGVQNNVIGGATVAARNIISGNQNQGVVLNGAGTMANRISGNYIGTNPAGTSAIPNGSSGLDIFSSASVNTVGGTAPGEGNVISGNTTRGITIAGGNNNVFTGNFIGLNAAGTAALANAGAGLQIFGGAQGNTIGATSGGRNFIAGNSGAGVTISDAGTNGNFIVGNSIGITPGGTVAANTQEGISLFGGPQGNTIGGTTVGAANLISGNTGPGVAIYNDGTTGNRINGNSITANGGLGIDLWNDGVTANDAGDADTGPANLQNFPTLNSAVVGVGTTINFTLSSTPAIIQYRVEFFANAPGSNEGRDFLGAINVSTAASGTITLGTTFSACVPAGQLITATATDPAGNTSEFSATRVVTTTDTDGDGLPNAYETANSLSTSLNDANMDSDGDGMTNAQEFRAGTDPRNPTSVFRLAAPITADGDKTLSLANLAGRTYRIDYADVLSTPTPWRILADQIPGNGANIPITDPGAASLPQRFYRALIVP